jgi:hypothetical protein
MVKKLKIKKIIFFVQQQKTTTNKTKTSIKILFLLLFFYTIRKKSPKKARFTKNTINIFFAVSLGKQNQWKRKYFIIYR